MASGPEMAACPHCGTPNSVRRQTCYACQGALTPTAAPAVPRPKPLERRAGAAGPAPAKDGGRVPGLLLGATLTQRAQFYHQLHNLLRAGIPLSVSLSHLRANIASHLRGLASALELGVQRGETFSSVMARFATIFPEWEVSLVRAHEKTGDLPDAMRDIAHQLDLEADMRRRVNMSTWHLKATAVVFVLVALVVFFVVRAQGLDAVMAALRSAVLLFLVVVAVGVAVRQAWQGLSLTRGGARFVQRVVQSTPLIGPITRDIQRLRFTRVLAGLWAAGIPPAEALETAARASGNQHLVYRAKDQVAGLQQGGSFADAVAQTRILPPEALYLVRTGEESGEMSASLENVARYLEGDLEAKIKTLPAKAQLVLYALLVPLVAAFAIAFYSGYGQMLMSIGE